jgi:DNA polymerase III subunit epsilon
VDFLALDVETANPDLASICQIGIVCFEDGAVSKTWEALVNPEDYFDPMNVSIHGIHAADVRHAPTLPQLFPDLCQMLESNIVASHTPFDRVALNRAAAKYGLAPIECSWLDTARVVRRAWSEHSHRGYGLADICEALGILFEHHVAVEDACAAGQVLLRAVSETGIEVKDWLHRAQQPIALERVARDGSPDGPLAGETIVFTGTLDLTRREAADLAARAGCSVSESVTKRTTLLVIGDYALRQLGADYKSSKHHKAEQLLAQGQSIRILQESDFMWMVGLT